MVKVAVVGASGYAGAQLCRIISRHEKLELTGLFVSENSLDKGKKISELYGELNGVCDKVLQPLTGAKDIIDIADAVFLATDHKVSHDIAPALVDAGVAVFDLSGAFRISNTDVFEKAYGFAHEHKDLLKKAVYALAEYVDVKALQNTKMISLPGCYPTASQLALKPLIENGLLDLNYRPSINAVSGVSGAGRNAKVDLIFTEVNENFKAYNVLQHRHTPEIKQEMDKLCNSNINLVFTPHLLPINRGILSTIYLDVKEELKEEISEEKIYKLYKEFYKNEHFVRITEDLPEIKNIKNSNICEIGIRYDREYGNIVVVSAIDNLIKGAGGQAVQSMNIMFGLDEFEGLEFLSMYL